MFPVGVSKDRIISVDFQIMRTSQYEVSKKYNLKITNPDEFKEMWILKSFISVYDKKQKLISSEAFRTTFVGGKKYLDSLEKIYSLGLKLISNNYKNIELFTPEYLSFCNFQHKCQILRVKHDSIKMKDYFIYQNKWFEVSIFKDTTFYGIAGHEEPSSRIDELYINSIRIYKAKNFKLIVSHLATGHEISMGWITNDPKKKSKGENEVVILAKEHKPKIPFHDIRRSVYEEPLLHHGYGLDMFIIH